MTLIPKANGLTRRGVMSSAAALAATGLIARPSRLRAADPVRMAGIYTVPVEQQWVGRIHKAALAAQDAADFFGFALARVLDNELLCGDGQFNRFSLTLGHL